MRVVYLQPLRENDGKGGLCREGQSALWPTDRGTDTRRICRGRKIHTLDSVDTRYYVELTYPPALTHEPADSCGVRRQFDLLTVQQYAPLAPMIGQGHCFGRPQSRLDIHFPMPERLTVWGLVIALSAISMVAKRVPFAVGLNSMLTVQLVDAAKIDPQVVADCA